jgi:dihydrofolate reductase
MRGWNLSVAVSAEWGIGKDGGLLFSIPGDLPRFKRLTMGKVVAMGYNTFLSLPGGKPLKGRVNIVLCHEAMQIDGATVVTSPQAMREALLMYPPADVWIIGGGMVYREFLADCAAAYVTKVDAAPAADTFMPDLDELPQWEMCEESEPVHGGGLTYRYCLYKAE